MPQATLPRPVEVDQSRRAPGGLLARAAAPPENWQRGLTIPFYGCGEPVVGDGCVIGSDTPAQDAPATFLPFEIRQGAFCSTLSAPDAQGHASGRLAATSEWAVGRQLATGDAIAGTVSLADATDLGAFVDPVAGLCALLDAAADTGFGARIWLHGPWAAIPVLLASGQVTDGMTAGIFDWIFSPGYPRLGGPNLVRVWATSTVWAAVDAPLQLERADFRQNSAEAWANRAGIVAFDPCVNLSVDIPCVDETS